MGGIIRGSRKIAITSSLPGIWRRPNAQPAKMPIAVLIATAMTPDDQRVLHDLRDVADLDRPSGTSRA